MSALVATVEMTILVLLASILAGPILGARFRVPGLLALIFLAGLGFNINAFSQGRASALGFGGDCCTDR